MEEVKTEERKYCVYMHTNKINNKVYIGQTCQQPPEKRWGLSGWGYKTNKYFWKAIQKYGFDNFEHIIFADELTKEEANKMEMMLIRFYETRDPNKGYNLTDGGEGNVGYHPSPETLSKLSAALRNPSEETRRKMSEAKKGKPGNRRGVKFSEEERMKMREQHKDAQKCVVQLDKDGKFVAEYESIREAHRSTGVPRKGISQCCNHKLLTSGEYQWMFKKDYLQNGATIYKDPIVKPVVQISMDGEFVSRYDSIVQASEATNIRPTDIGACCRNVVKSAGGYQWVFEEKYSDADLTEYTGGNKRSVVQLDKDGRLIRIYSSATEAAEDIGVSSSSITHCCRGHVKSVGEYMWQYYEDYNEQNTVAYKRWGRHMTVIQLSLDLQFINEFQSIKDAIYIVGGYGGYITDCCKGRKKTYKGYIWKYKKDWEEMQCAKSINGKN